MKRAKEELPITSVNQLMVVLFKYHNTLLSALGKSNPKQGDGANEHTSRHPVQEQQR